MVALSFFLHVCILGSAAFTWKNRYPLYVPKALSVKLIGPLSRSKDKGSEGSPAEKKGEEKKTVKTAPPEKNKTMQEPAAKKTKPAVSKDEMQVLENKMQLLRAKKRVEEIAKLKSIVDISTQGVAEKVKKGSEGNESTGSDVQAGSASGEAQQGLLDNYINTISAQIRKEWVYPEVFRKNDLETVVSVRIDAEGNITVLGVEKSSQNGLFDRSIMRAITKASPVRRPPFAMEIGMRFHP
jgi:TonB family protein